MRDPILLPTLHVVRLDRAVSRSHSARLQNYCNWLAWPFLLAVGNYGRHLRFRNFSGSTHHFSAPDRTSTIRRGSYHQSLETCFIACSTASNRLTASTRISCLKLSCPMITTVTCRMIASRQRKGTEFYVFAVRRSSPRRSTAYGTTRPWLARILGNGCLRTKMRACVSRQP